MAAARPAGMALAIRTADRHRRGPGGRLLLLAASRGVVVLALGGVVAAQAAVVAVLDRGGEQVERFDELGDGGVTELVGQSERQRATHAVCGERTIGAGCRHLIVT